MILPKPLLDHFPILLEGRGSSIRGPMPFKFENMWLKQDNFKGLIDRDWKSFSFSGFSSYIVVEKLKALKLKIKYLTKEVFG